MSILISFLNLNNISIVLRFSQCLSEELDQSRGYKSTSRSAQAQQKFD